MLKSALFALVLLVGLLAGGGALLSLSGCDTGGACEGGELETVNVTVGTGEAATDDSQVLVNYVGTLENGDVFEQREEIRFTLESRLAAFREGVVGMREGGTRRIAIPPSAAFGEEGVPGVIPSCETITFSVTLLEVYPSTCEDGTLATTELVVGNGAQATASSRVRVSYVGRLEDGTVFDQSGNATFTLSGTVPGFRDGVAGMREGGRRRIVVPPNLGYGAEGVDDAIPPCATLTFEVELFEVLS